MKLYEVAASILEQCFDPVFRFRWFLPKHDAKVL